MIKIYKELDSGKLETIELDNNSDFILDKGCWIDIKNPDEKLLKKVSKLTGISEEMLLTSLDEEESAHVDIDDGDTLIVLDTPYVVDQENAVYSTAPFIIAYNRSYFVTISKYNFELINDLFKKVKKIEPHKHVRTSLHLIYRLTSIFISYLKRIDLHTKAVEKKLHSSMKNKELLELMNINKILVYFSTALNADKAVLSKLVRNPNYKKYETDQDLMDDAEIEMNQAIEMCSIYRDILAGMMDAFASIISNNLNVVMKTLAVITIILSIPTLVASFWGMNFSEIPLDSNKYGFYIVAGISLALSVIGAIVLIIFSNKVRRK